MPSLMKSLGIDRLSVDDRLALMDEIWESVAASPDAVHLTDAQRADLDRRLDYHEAHPDEGSSWEEVKARIRAGK